MGAPTDRVEFIDVFDPSMIEGSDVLGLLFVFPITPVFEKVSQDGESDVKITEKFWFTKQTVGNACGTIALLHLFCNLDNGCFPMEGILKDFYFNCTEKSPQERASVLESEDRIAEAHQKAETEGQSGHEDKVEEHYICIMPHYEKGKLRKIVELDGRRDGPVAYDAEANIFVDAAFKHINKRYFSVDPQEYRFCVIAAVTKGSPFDLTPLKPNSP